MEPGAATNPSYYQFYQTQFHNPTPNPMDPQLNPWPIASASASASASAPPVASSDYPPNYYPPSYTPNSSDHLVNSPSPAYSNPNPPSHYPYEYDHNHPSYYSYHQNPPSGPAQGHQFSSPPPPSPSPYASYEDSWGAAGCYSEDNSNTNTNRYREEEHTAYADDGVYRYQGPKLEPYSARGTPAFSNTSSQLMFDDYGRPIHVSNDNVGSKAPKVVKAVPKADTEEDVKAGLQKFRVKLLSEGYAHTEQDVLFQIGLDGIRMLDPATNQTLRIYPLETLTRWEVLDSYIFAFWAKMPVDVEPKRIRLKSNSYTTNTILDIVTAASVQLKEIGERKDPNTSKATEVQGDKKKGFDWINLIKPPNEEKDHWVPDEAVNQCSSCGTNFNAFVRKHHCRNCGEIFCDKCTQGRTPLTAEEQAPAVRVCDRCMAEVTQRLTNTREAANRSGALLSHEDLAKKLKEELNRNSKASTGSKSEGSQVRMREVACPTCTVHLQNKLVKNRRFWADNKLHGNAAGRKE